MKRRSPTTVSSRLLAFRCFVLSRRFLPYRSVRTSDRIAESAIALVSTCWAIRTVRRRLPIHRLGYHTFRLNRLVLAAFPMPFNKLVVAFRLMMSFVSPKAYLKRWTPKNAENEETASLTAAVAVFTVFSGITCG